MSRFTEVTKEVLTNWSVDGNKLVHPLQIFRRVLVWPFIKILGYLIVILAFLGWGKDEAIAIWEDLP
jgi:hypothetical protein